jgi:Flp pilus assembly protein TadG
MTKIATSFRLCRQRLADFRRDRSGIAATEFVVIVPLMLVLFFGTVEFSQGIAVDRKVTIIARTLSDLVSQNAQITDAQFTTFFQAGVLIVNPYTSTPLKQTISELYIDPNSHAAKVQWSKGDAARGVGSVVTIPTALAVDNTYLIFSETSYRYTPTIGYVMAPTGVNLTDVAYSRPRQSPPAQPCVLYGTSTCPTN